MEKRSKVIKLSDEVHRKLSVLKAELEFKDFDKTISYLLKEIIKERKK